MLNTFPAAVIVGIILGTLSGLGTGGGSLLILYLTLLLDFPQSEAKVINLLFFLPSAGIACLFRWKQGRLPLKKILPAILAGSIFAAIFTLFSSQWDTQILRKLFGILLLATGLRELFYRPKQNQPRFKEFK